jgi:hypothetical protein
VKPESEWVADPEWIAEEEVQTMAAQPLIYSGGVHGVLAVFDRKRLNEEEFRWLRIFADYAAIALTNARAFAQIEELRRKLEAENEYLREKVYRWPLGSSGWSRYGKRCSTVASLEEIPRANRGHARNARGVSGRSRRPNPRASVATGPANRNDACSLA